MGLGLGACVMLLLQCARCKLLKEAGSSAFCKATLKWPLRSLRALCGEPSLSPAMTAQEQQQPGQGSSPCHEIGFGRSVEHLLLDACARESAASHG